jgi:hypothetical protein
MGRLLTILFVLFLIFVGVGFYLQWFTLTLSGEDKGFRINLFVDKDKLEKDEKKAEDKLKKVGEEIKEKTSK